MEMLIQKAIAVIAMGGDNTFCEILSFDKRALIMPRTAPRTEQYIRASRAAEMELVSMLLPDESTDPGQMSAAIRALNSVNAMGSATTGEKLVRALAKSIIKDPLLFCATVQWQTSA